MSAIALAGVRKYLGDRAEGAVLEDLSLNTEAGELLAVVGPSGCGKSTLLNVIAGLLEPDSGAVVLDPPSATIGYVFQFPRLLPWRTALGNVEFGLEQRSAISRAQARERALSALDLVRLEASAHKHPHELSGGMQQRVALARALAIEPDLLLLDEPLAALDALTRGDLQEELADIVRRSRPTTVLVTHDIDEALLLADRVAVMSSRPGRILETVDMPFGADRTMETVVGDERYPALRTRLRALLRPALARPRGIAGPS